MSTCESCWSEAYSIGVRTGQDQSDVYRELVRQPRSHCHGLAIEQEPTADQPSAMHGIPSLPSVPSDARELGQIALRGNETAIPASPQDAPVWTDDFSASGELGPNWKRAYEGDGSGALSIATDMQRVPWVNTPTPNIVCPDCRKPFEYGHLATANVKPGEPAIFRHNDCANPTLAEAGPPEFWVDQVHDAVGDWEGL